MSTTPPSFPNLSGQGWSVHKRPTFSTRVASHVSAREVRTALYSHALYEFEVSYEGLASNGSGGSLAGLGASSLQTLLGFFMQCQGQFGTFLYSDPTDDVATGQGLGVGDGATTAFTFARAIGGYAETVGWVTSVTTVYVGGTAQGPGAWSLIQPNILSFVAPPPTGTVVTADFAYAFVCRFIDDSQDFENVMAGLWQLQSLKFRSIKP